MAGAGAKIIIIKKKGGGHGGHHGGAWKVAYADFVTAMMALFMVLWLLSQTDQKQREKISEYFRTGVLSGSVSVLGGGKGITSKGWVDIDTPQSIDDAGTQRQARLIAEAMEDAFERNAAVGSLKDHVNISVTEDGLLIQLIDGDDALLFDSSSADLKPIAVELLSKLAPILGDFGHKLQVHGHTDARPFPTGSQMSNWELSFRRADNARTLLQDHGVPAEEIVGVFAHADSAPLAGTDPKSSINRRLAILAVRKGSEALAAKGVPLSTQPGKPVELRSHHDEEEPKEQGAAKHEEKSHE
jgi:chemotaxis protein MotB